MRLQARDHHTHSSTLIGGKGTAGGPSSPATMLEGTNAVIRENFWAQPVEILVFASQTGDMFTSSGFPLLDWGIFYNFL